MKNESTVAAMVAEEMVTVSATARKSKLRRQQKQPKKWRRKSRNSAARNSTKTV